MTPRIQIAACALVVLGLGGCFFEPDLGRFPPCSEEDSCAVGSTCVIPERRCIPDCLNCEIPGDDGGEQSDAGPAETDGGGETDAGVDGGGGGEVLDAGDAGDPDFDAGTLSLVETVPTGVEGASYSTALWVDGGTPPYWFSSPDASLPLGVTLTDAGELAGTPAEPGTFVLHPHVRDSSNPPLSESAFISWTVLPKLRFAGPALLAIVTTGQQFKESVSAHGGVPPYRFEVIEGGFSGSVALSPDGGFSGSTSTNITRDAVVQVTDSSSPPQTDVGTVNFQSETPGLLPPVKAMTRKIPDGRVGFPFRYMIQADHGSPGYKYDHTSGTMPPGLVLNRDTGVLSGTPQQAGNYVLGVTIRDALNATADGEYPIKVY